jgi:hypothetical protein
VQPFPVLAENLSLRMGTVLCVAIGLCDAIGLCAPRRALWHVSAGWDTCIGRLCAQAGEPCAAWAANEAWELCARTGPVLMTLAEGSILGHRWELCARTGPARCR